jgi:long-subunit fatty acid transport protein
VTFCLFLGIGLSLGLNLSFPASAIGGAFESVEIPSSPNPVGSGARALGMGGAFIAVADDATAASWNPGGLIQLERPEISAVGAAFSRTEDLRFRKQSGGSGEQSVTGAGLNYLSAAYPFSISSHNMIVSFNYQHLYDFSREWKFDFFDGIAKRKRDFKQDGGLYAYGLAYCLQILPELSLGFTLNLWEDGVYENGWNLSLQDSSSFTRGGMAVRTDSSRKDRFSFRGFNANVGMLWNVTSKLTMGAVFKSPFTADLEHHFRLVTTERLGPVSSTRVKRGTFSEELDMPMSYGLGLAYRFSDQWTVSADVYRTEWEDFILTQSDGQTLSPVSGLKASESDVDGATQVRLGTEYLVIKPKYLVPLRAGVFYDPAPAEGSPDSYFGFSLGSGVGIGRFIFDIAYQYRFGNDVGSSILRHLEFSEDIGEHTVYASLIVHF